MLNDWTLVVPYHQYLPTTIDLFKLNSPPIIDSKSDQPCVDDEKAMSRWPCRGKMWHSYHLRFLFIFTLTFFLTSVLNYWDNSFGVYQLANATHEPQNDKVLVMYGFVPKISEAFAEICRSFQTNRQDNNYRVVELNHVKQFLSRDDQKKFVQTVWTLKRPVMVMDFVRFVDFSNFSKTDIRPIYFAMVENPIKRFLFWYSQFLKDRSTPKYIRNNLCSNTTNMKNCVLERLNMNVSQCLELNDDQCQVYPELVEKVTFIPLFCGHMEACNEPLSAWAYQMAKFNIEKWFPLVGVVEQLNETLTVAGKRIPYFFDGISAYLSETNEGASLPLGMDEKDIAELLTPQARGNLEIALRDEIHFYDYLLQRIHRQAILARS